ncbi:hypothetical protein [Sphingobium yanoikuyae]|uniref:hypothetical protein n=1 Tax=Sphingobium yanoikuyae TaxID=13690 RepID=UPI000262C01E|nr:hypothetical protein [Sphingobium yanoikuyae]
MTDAVKMAIEALRPFADAAGHIHPAHPDEATSLDGFPMSDFRRAAQALAALEQAGEPVDAVLLDRAELAWQRFFYPAADCFTGPAADKLPAVDLEVADCLRLVLAAVGRLVVTPEADVPAPLPTLQRLGQEFDAGEVEPFAYMLRDSDGKVFWDEDMCIWTHREDAEEAAEDKGMTMFGVYDGPFPPQSRGQAFDGELPLKFDPRDAKLWWEENMKESKFVSARLAGDGYVKFQWRDADESGDYSVPWTRIALWLAALSSAKRGEREE